MCVYVYDRPYGSILKIYIEWTDMKVHIHVHLNSAHMLKLEHSVGVKEAYNKNDSS